MLRLPVMKHFVAVVFVLSACAGPEEHRRANANAAMDPSTVAAERSTAGSVLDADSPLDVGEKPAPAKPHHHHPGMQMPAPEPAPEEKPAAEKPPDAKPHVHPVAAPSPETVEDPVCHMKIKPAKAAGGSLTVDGVTSYFCSSSCREKFLAAHPEAK
ncbi:MAG: YHS domain-containing protein [Archangium sp.]|nr:YHS domain-containing protein [Archangium sp.]